MNEEGSCQTVSNSVKSILFRCFFFASPKKDENEDIFVCNEDLIARVVKEDEKRKWGASDFPELLEAYQRFLETDLPEDKNSAS